MDVKQGNIVYTRYSYCSYSIHSCGIDDMKEMCIGHISGYTTKIVRAEAYDLDGIKKVTGCGLSPVWWRTKLQEENILGLRRPQQCYQW